MCLGLKCGKADRLSYQMLLRRVITAKERHITPFEKGDQNHACGKTANMRKIGNAATITGKCIWYGDELATNPDAENDPSGQIDESYKNHNEHKSANCCLWV